MKILIVDDEEDFLIALEGVLQEKGYEVVRALDGKMAREALEEEKIDLIISDVYMPTLDGIRFHTFVREYTDARDVPFIFISGYPSDYLQKLVENSSRDFFLRKPTPIQDILALIERALKTPPVKGS